MTAVVPSPRLPKDKLVKLFEFVSGVQVPWSTARRGLLGLRPKTERAWLVLSVSAWQELGTDELRVKWNAERQANDELLCGQRAFTANLQAFSLDPGLTAIDLCERVRFRLRTKAARALMIPTIALRDFQAVVQLPPIEDAVPGGHIIDRASLDVRMLCSVSADPNDPGGGGVIETADLPPPVVGGNLIP